MSDTVVVMSGGKIQQMEPAAGYLQQSRRTPLWPDFIGDSNIVDGVMLRDFRVEFGGQELTCVDTRLGAQRAGAGGGAPSEDVQIVPAVLSAMLTGVVRERHLQGRALRDARAPWRALSG